LNKRYFIGLGICVVLTAALCFSALVLKSNPTVHTEAYRRNDVTDVADIQSIRSNMQSLGFQTEVLKDLPDNEAELYRNVISVQSSTYQQTIDAGVLEITKYTSTASRGATRILYYYKWITLPKHKYCDEFYVYLPTQMLYTNDVGFNGLGLYDKESTNGVTTYKAEFVKTDPRSMNGNMHTEVSYKIFGNVAKNQRGYFAYNAQMKSSDKESIFNSFVNYSHQKSIFNFNFSNETNSNSKQIMFSGSIMLNNDKRAAFDRFQLIFENKYKP
jgi:hypothetical protein